MKFYSEGKRSFVYKQGAVVVKVEKPNIQAVARIENEAKWLQVLNKKGIGPIFYHLEENELYMEFIDGVLLLEYVKGVSKKKTVEVLLDLLEQCRVMDLLLVSKFEMHHPLKHVIVREGKPVQIDFERCKTMLKPKNVTQLCQFYTRYFGVKGLQEIAKVYKGEYEEKEYRKIRQCVINTI